MVLPSGYIHEGIVAWKPIPDDGISVYEREPTLYGGDRSGAYVRPPKPVYEPGDTSVRLNPAPPPDLLVAMRDGAQLTERAWR